MALKLKEAPETEPIELEEAKLHLRVDTDADDDYIENLIKAAREFCEDWQRRAYITQTWELWIDAFPHQPWIRLDRSPLQAIDLEVAYYDVDDFARSFDNFFIDTISEPGYIVLNAGASWPSMTLRPANGICVTFKAGYGEAEDVPMTMKQAILLLISNLYENREPVTSAGGMPKDIPFSIKALLNQNKVY